MIKLKKVKKERKIKNSNNKNIIHTINDHKKCIQAL